MFTKNKSRPDGLDNYCVTCRREQSKLWKLKNKEKVHKYNSEHYLQNKKYHVLKAASWAENNKTKFLISNRKSRKKWAVANLDLLAFKRAKRRALENNSEPAWLSKDHKEEIQDFYTAAKMFQLYTGQKYHVDHIVPLVNNFVCGLNVPWNLQILSAKENLQKSNKLNVE